MSNPPPIAGVYYAGKGFLFSFKEKTNFGFSSMLRVFFSCFCFFKFRYKTEIYNNRSVNHLSIVGVHEPVPHPVFDYHQRIGSV